MQTALKSTWIWVAIVGLSALALGFISLPKRTVEEDTSYSGKNPRDVMSYQWKTQSGWSYSYKADTGATDATVVPGGEGTHTLELQRAYDNESAKNHYRICAYGSFNGKRYPNMDKPGTLMLTPINSTIYGSASEATSAAVQWVTDYAAAEASTTTVEVVGQTTPGTPDDATISDAALRIQGVDSYDMASNVTETIQYNDPFNSM